MQPTSLLDEILHSQNPGSIVCCGETACRIAEKWTQEHPSIPLYRLTADNPNSDLPLPQIYDLAIISETLENLSQAQASTFLGQLRNAGARRIAVLVEAGKTWRFTDFIALSFKRSSFTEGPQPQTLYTYDIASYNHKRKWNNSDNWANPHMWDKARW